MPIYEYRHKISPKKCKDPFEIIQLASHKSIRLCPNCKKPVERVLSIFTSHKNVLSDSNLREKGFSKFVPEGPGRIRKVV